MKKVVICFSIFFPLILLGQEREIDTLKWKASLSVTGFWQAGNVDTWIFRAKADVRYKPLKKWEFQTINSYVYQEFGKEKADEDVLSLNFLRFKSDRRFYPLLLGFVSTNFRREIDLRYLVGAGVNYKVVDSKKYYLEGTLSSEFEQTNFSMDNFNIEAYDGSKEITTIRSTVWLSGKYHLFEKKLILSHQTYFQPSLQENNNFRWSGDISVELPISKYINFKVNYLHTYESIVIEGQKREDQFLTFGVTIKSYE